MRISWSDLPGCLIACLPKLDVCLFVFLAAILHAFAVGDYAIRCVSIHAHHVVVWAYKCIMHYALRQAHAKSAAASERSSMPCIEILLLTSRSKPQSEAMAVGSF